MYLAGDSAVVHDDNDDDMRSSKSQINSEKCEQRHANS